MIIPALLPSSELPIHELANLAVSLAAAMTASEPGLQPAGRASSNSEHVPTVHCIASLLGNPRRMVGAPVWEGGCSRVRQRGGKSLASRKNNFAKNWQNFLDKAC